MKTPGLATCHLRLGAARAGDHGGPVPQRAAGGCGLASIPEAQVTSRYKAP